MIAEVRQAYAQQREDKAKVQSNELQGQQEPRKRDISHVEAAERYAEETRKRDDGLCLQVARRRAAKMSIT
jgi:hypothetical protein